MNGPEHYREAEEQLELAAGSEGGSHTERYALGAAQVHATLAVAAAMIAAPYVVEGDTTEEWVRIVSSAPAAPATAQPAPADLTVYELRAGTDDEPDHVATYGTATAAALHGEALYQAKHGRVHTLMWPPTGTDDHPRYRLVAVDDLDGDETETDWHIVQVTVPGAYVPVSAGAGESRG